MSMSNIAFEDDRDLAEASAWLVRLQRDEVSEADGLEFEAWLDAAPGNRAAYEHVVSL